MPHITRAIILGAGRGVRLAPHTDERPKCLVDVGGRSLLAHQVHRLVAVGVEHVTVVGGFRIDALREAVRALSDATGATIAVVQNPDYETTNTARSLWLAVDGERDGFYLMNGDVLFPVDVLRALDSAARERGLEAGFAVEVSACGDEEVKVRVDEDLRIRAISKEVDPATALGEFIGVARLGAAAVSHLVGALAATVAESHPMAYFEEALERMAGHTALHAVPVNAPVIEIDFPEDLERARQDIVLRIERLEAD